jgi:hypothetical protein
MDPLWGHCHLSCFRPQAGAGMHGPFTPAGSASGTHRRPWLLLQPEFGQGCDGVVANGFGWVVPSYLAQSFDRYCSPHDTQGSNSHSAYFHLGVLPLPEHNFTQAGCGVFIALSFSSLRLLCFPGKDELGAHLSPTQWHSLL